MSEKRRRGWTADERDVEMYAGFLSFYNERCATNVNLDLLAVAPMRLMDNNKM